MARETLDLISTPVKIIIVIYAAAVIATVAFLAGSLTGTTTTAPETVTETTTATTTTPVAPCDGPDCPPWPSLDY